MKNNIQNSSKKMHNHSNTNSHSNNTNSHRSSTNLNRLELVAISRSKNQKQEMSGSKKKARI